MGKNQNKGGAPNGKKTGGPKPKWNPRGRPAGGAGGGTGPVPGPDQAWLSHAQLFQFVTLSQNGALVKSMSGLRGALSRAEVAADRMRTAAAQSEGSSRNQPIDLDDDSDQEDPGAKIRELEAKLAKQKVCFTFVNF